MGKIDEVKEVLNSLRIWLSISMGVTVVTAGGMIGRYDSGRIDTIFYLGFAFLFLMGTIVALLARAIARKTKEIGEL